MQQCKPEKSRYSSIHGKQRLYTGTLLQAFTLRYRAFYLKLKPKNRINCHHIPLFVFFYLIGN